MEMEPEEETRVARAPCPVLPEREIPHKSGASALGGRRRLAALRRSGLLDTPPEEAFDRVVRLAARLLQAPVALVTLVEPHRQSFKAAVGLDGPLASERETPISHSFCQHVVARDAPLVVGDASEHPLVRDNPGRRDSGVEAYLGVPLRTPAGEALGSLCVFDYEPRLWSAEDERALEELAAVLTDELAFRDVVRQREQDRQVHAAIRALTEASFDAITDIFFILDLDGGLLRWNERMSEVTGHAGDDLAGMHALAFFSDEDRLAVAEAIGRVYDEGRAVVEADLLTTEGPVPYELNGSPLRNGEGRVIGLCGTARDVSERTRAETALAESERFLRSTIDALSAHVAVLDEGGVIVAVNEAWRTFARANGAAPEAVGVGTDYFGACEAAGEDGAEVMRAVRDVLAGRRAAYELEYPCHSPDEERWFVLRVSRFAGEGPPRAVVAHEDVTERHLAEGALRLSEARHRGLVEAMPDVFFRFTREGLCLDLETHGVALVRDDVSSRPGHRISDVLPEALAARWLDTIGAALDAGRLQDLEYELTLGGGGRRHFEARIVPVDRDEVQAIVRDVTDQKRYEAALVEAKEQAEAARTEAEASARLKSSLLANMSHEIRTPLTGIIGFADLLAEEVGGEQRDFARLIGRSSRRLTDTLNSVLDLAQLDAGRYRLALTALDLRVVAREAIELLEPRAAAKGIVLRCDVPEEAVVAAADAAALGRVITNLVSNAVKFTDAGSVTVAVRALPDGAEVRVEDTGVGIGEAFLPHLFDEFRQESEGEARSHEGSGLGLSITKRLVELMSGTITVASRKGTGSTFSVRLPSSLGEVLP